MLAAGNTDGDLAMLQWTAASPGRTLQLVICHTDAEWEYAYDRDSHIGRLNLALDAAAQNNWIVASMKDDWRTVFRSLQ